MPWPTHETPVTEVFPLTNTRLVRSAAGQLDDVDPEAVWRELIEAYAGPIARTLRRHWSGADDAEVRSFFAYLYEHEVLASFDKNESRFRCFIQGVARNFARERRREASGRPPTAAPVDDVDGPADPNGEFSEQAEEHAWASAVLGQAFAVLRAERPRDAQLLAGHHGLAGRARVTHAELALELGTTPNAVGVALNAAHRRLGTLIRAQLRYHCPRRGEDERGYEAECALVLARLREASPTLEFDGP